MAIPVSTRVLSVHALFSLGRFAPAAVQRDFQWGPEHARQLLTDVERCFASAQAAAADGAPSASFAAEQAATADGPAGPDEEAAIDADVTSGMSAQSEGPAQDYFLGAIVTAPGAGGAIDVFDGLQRMTTLTILIALLRDKISDAALSGRLHMLLALPDGTYRLHLPGRDDTLRGEAQNPGRAVTSPRREPATDMGIRVRKVLRTLRNQMANWDQSRLSTFAGFLLERVSVDLVEVNSPQLARQIFVTTNSRGLPIDRVDLLKGQLMDVAGDDRAAADVLQTWTAIRSEVGDDLEDFFEAVDTIVRRQPKNPACLADLAAHLAIEQPGAKIVAWLRWAGFLGQAWSELHRCLDAPGGTALERDIWRLGLFDWTDWKPLAVFWLADYRKNPDNPAVRRAAERRFNALHRRCMALSLALYSETDIDRFFRNALTQAKNRANPLVGADAALNVTQEAHERIRQTLRMPIYDDRLRLVLVRWLEASLWPDAPPASIASASVEHVLPQRPENVAEWMALFPSEEERHRQCHSLGNFAALSYGENVRLQNSAYAVKLAVYRQPRESYKTLAAVARHDTWSAAIIAERQAALADIAWTGLALPTVPRTSRRARGKGDAAPARGGSRAVETEP